MSIQVNLLTVETHVQGIASDIHQDCGDNSVLYSVSFNCSVLQHSTHTGYFLFLTLGCAVPVIPGRVIIFSGIK